MNPTGTKRKGNCIIKAASINDFPTSPLITRTNIGRNNIKCSWFEYFRKGSISTNPIGK